MLFIDSVRIDPGNAFRLVVKVSKFVADGKYGLVEMADQEHEIWFYRTVTTLSQNFMMIWPQRSYGGHHKLSQSGQLRMIVNLNEKSEEMNTFIS